MTITRVRVAIRCKNGITGGGRITRGWKKRKGEREKGSGRVLVSECKVGAFV